MSPDQPSPSGFSSFDEVEVHGGYSMAEAKPLADIGGLVLRYQGFEAASPVMFSDRVQADLFIPVIINFGERWAIASGGRQAASHDSFTAGLIDRFTAIECAGRPSCLQIDFTPFGARAFFGRPLHELTSSVIAFADVAGRDGGAFVERLAELPDWRSRLQLADRLVRQRLRGAAPVNRRVSAGWRRLAAQGARLSIRDLAAELDCSREHLTRLFREQTGHSPKAIARIMRYHAVKRIAPGLGCDWAATAHEAGYADQAHLIREFRQMSGEPPAAWAASHSFNTP